MRRRHVQAASLLAAAVVMAGCGSSSKSNSGSLSNAGGPSSSTAPSSSTGGGTGSAVPGPPLKLSVGVGAAVYTAPLTTPAFTAAGIQLAPRTVTSGAVAVPLLLNGQLQFSEADAVGALSAIGKGAPIEIVGAVTSGGSSPAADNSNVLVKPGSSIRSAADLSGKKVAVNTIGGAAQLSAAAAIDKLGGDSSKAHFVELPPTAILPAITQGTVDAGVTSAIDPQAAGLRSVLSPVSTALPGAPLIVWIATKPYVAKHRDVVQRFAAATAQANTYLSSHPDVVRKVSAQTSQVKLSPAQEASTILPQFTPATLTKSGLQEIVNLLLRAKVINSPVDLSTAAFPQ